MLDGHRLVLSIDSGDGLDRVLDKSPDAVCLIRELADDLSPRGWMCAGPSRSRETISARDLIARAARQLEDEVPDFMRDLPQIRDQVAALRELLAPAPRITLVVLEPVAPGGEADTSEPPSRWLPGEGGTLVDTIGNPGMRPPSLAEASLSGVANFLSSPACKRVVVLTGAGISTNCGIPDYRGAGGLVASLNASELSASAEETAMIAADPERVSHADLFRQNPRPFLEVKRELVRGLAEGLYGPSAFHSFVALLHTKGKLSMVLTQNIDGLHSAAGLPDDVLIEAHGTARHGACDACGARLELDKLWTAMRSRVRDLTGRDEKGPAESSVGGVPCPAGCGRGSVKPAVVLFGQPTDPRLTEARTRAVLREADLLVIAGTSLAVAPFNELPDLVKDDCVRIVLNATQVGEAAGLVFSAAPGGADHSRSQSGGGALAGTRDVLCLGDIDHSTAALATEAGWGHELSAHCDSVKARFRLPRH